MEKYDVLKLENQLCFPLYAVAKEAVRRNRKPLEKLGLTYTQYIVIMVLWEHGSMIEKELAEIVHLYSGTLAPLLRRLEKQGHYHPHTPRKQREQAHDKADGKW